MKLKGIRFFRDCYLIAFLPSPLNALIAVNALNASIAVKT